MSSRRRTLLVTPVALLALIGAALYIVNSPPGGQQVIDQTERVDPRPEPSSDRVEALRLPWDSEGYADWSVAELLASVSETAYLAPVEAEVSYRALGFDRVDVIVQASMVGYVISARNATVVVFRGTDDPSDWIANLDRFAVETPHGAIHRGFYRAYQLVRPQVVKLLAGREVEHLWITGHSLGGALALVCAYDLVENEAVDLDGIVTFGQPMVARKQLATYMDDLLLGRYALIANDADIVSRIPPSHTHCGSLVWFTRSGVKRSRPKRLVVGTHETAEPFAEAHEEIAPLSEQEFEQLQAELRSDRGEIDRLPDGTPVVQGSSPWIRDHLMSLYLEKIRAFLRNGESQ